MKKKIFIGLIILLVFIFMTKNYQDRKAVKDILNTINEEFIILNTKKKSDKIKFYMDSTKVVDNTDSKHTTLMYDIAIVNTASEIIHVQDVIYIISNKLNRFSLQDTKSRFMTDRHLIPEQVYNLTLQVDLIKTDEHSEELFTYKDVIYLAVKIDGYYYYYILNSEELPDKDNIINNDLQFIVNELNLNNISKKYGLNKNRFHYSDKSLKNAYQTFITQLDSSKWTLKQVISEHNKIYYYNGEHRRKLVEIIGIECSIETYPENGSYVILRLINDIEKGE